jgi:Caspase domain
VTSPAVTVVAIGIERYDTDLFSDVPGPARDASRFASLMHTLGVPERNILVALSYVDATSVGPGVERYPLATRTGIGSLLGTELAARDGDVLIVYWAGHGYQERSGGQRLLLPDPPGISSVTLEQVRNWLLGSRIRFAEQLLFVDACREERNVAAMLNLPLEFPQVSRARGRRQSVMHAVGAGEESPLIAGERTSVFSKALFDILRDVPLGQWPPDVRLLAKQLSTGNHGLAPVTVNYSDPRGNGDQVHLGVTGRAVDTGDRSGSPVQRVSRALLNVPSMNDKRNIRELLQRIKFKYRGAFFSEPIVSRIVLDVSEMNAGWERLREVCVESIELFPPDNRAVKQLMEILDALVWPTNE